jgi:4-amino-4-deoxy-L-arabinose transferase-like glycosyltransferase
MKLVSAILLVLFTAGLIFRTFRLGDRPLGFTWDEAALGYNAYSLLLTGKDEHGVTIPMVFESFSDYKPGLYIYLIVPLISLFGLSEFSTRAASAILGALCVVLIFLFSRKFLPTRHCLSISFLVSVNPWLLHFSRGAWEANVALSLSLSAITLFIYRKFYLSAIFFGLTLYTYQGSKLFTPLLLLSLVFVGLKQIKMSYLLRPMTLLLIIVLPLLLGLSTESGRLKVQSVFSYRRSSQAIENILMQDGAKSLDVSYFLFHTEILDQLRGITQRYLNHFSPQYLFFTGDWSSLRHSDSYQGYFYITEILTILIGAVVCIRRYPKLSKLLFLWLFLAPLPAALSRDIVSGVRSLPLSIPILIFSGIGLG